MQNDLRVLLPGARVGKLAHPWGARPLRLLLALLAGGCSGSASEPAPHSVELSADFAACGQCDTVEVVLLRGEPPICALARATVALPATQAGPQIGALDEPVTVAVWAACSTSDPTVPPPDPSLSCEQAAQVCTNQLPGGIPGLDPAQLLPVYQSLCGTGSQSPLQQCCAMLMPCLNSNAPACEQELAQCAQLLGIPFTPGQIDINQIKQIVQAYCAPNSTATAECCAALGQCMNGPNPTPQPSCVACRVLQRVERYVDRLELQVEPTQSCERPPVIDLPDC